MPASMNLRVVIACVSFETVKIVKPAQFYKADKVYLLHKGDKLIIMAFEYTDSLIVAKVALVDEKNQFVRSL